MELVPGHISALESAERLIIPKDFSRHLDLKDLWRDDSRASRENYRKRFTNLYGLNVGGLTDQFKDRYFEILFGDGVMVHGHPDYAGILEELSTFKRKNGHPAMPFSFVSKLVAQHDEGRPIYDRHVRDFFQGKDPGPRVGKEARIDWFVAFLDGVAGDYRAWAADKRIALILARFKARDARLGKCHEVRLMDFLVWKVGNRKLLSK